MKATHAVPQRTPRIAVLPFSNLSEDPSEDYFCEGLAAEILIALARIPGLHLVARSSVFALHQQQHTALHIGRRLKATEVLEGAIRKNNGQLSITITLIDVPSGKEMWTGEFERALQDLLAVLDRIAAGVARALAVKSVPDYVRKIQHIHTENVEAYDHYLQGRRFYYQFSNSGIEAALGMFRKAIAIDDRYALAYCGIADCYSYLHMYVESSDLNREQAVAASHTALELDPLLPEAHASHGVALSLGRKQFAEAEAAFKRALELDPQLFEAHYLYARVCFAQGKLEEAAAHYAAAHEKRPEDYQSLLLAGQIYDDLGRPEQAQAVRQEGVAVVEQHLHLHPEDTRALYMGANGLIALGDNAKGRTLLERALLLEPEDPMLLYNAGCIYALMNQTVEALACLEGSVAAGLTQREWYENDSNLDAVRTHPRFQALLDLMP